MLPEKSSKVNSKELAFLLVLNKFFRPHPRCECSYMREKKKSEPLNSTALILYHLLNSDAGSVMLSCLLLIPSTK